jgi:hypothetical protein
MNRFAAPPPNETASPEVTPTEPRDLSARADGLARAIPCTAATHTMRCGAPTSAPVGPSAAAELMMLDEVRGALAAGDPPHALSILEAYPRRFPHLALAPEHANGLRRH